MPDASGTPTSPDNIPTYNTAVDPPSGKGFNTAMAQIQTIITELKAGTLPSGKLAAASITPGTNGQILTTTAGVTSWGAGAIKTTVSAFSGGPPGSPADGDQWIATGIPSPHTSASTRWTFIFDATGSKWIFTGGRPWYSLDDAHTFAYSGGGVYQDMGANLSNFVKYTAVRPGLYLARASLVESEPAASSLHQGQIVVAKAGTSPITSAQGQGPTPFANSNTQMNLEEVVFFAAADVITVAYNCGVNGLSLSELHLWITPYEIT